MNFRYYCSEAQAQAQAQAPPPVEKRSIDKNAPPHKSDNIGVIKQHGGDFTDISPDDPNLYDPYEYLRFGFILDFFRHNFYTR
jgi:hypothetical protein